jgi:Alkylmercury lyase
VTDRELALSHTIMRSFADTGAPPDIDDEPTLRALAEQHVVALDEDDDRPGTAHPSAPRRGDRPHIRMAHPFAAHREGARVDSGGRTWWGSCAWDALGIVAALGLSEATVTAGDVVLHVEGDRARGDALFHVAVPARDWWADIGFT